MLNCCALVNSCVLLTVVLIYVMVGVYHEVKTKKLKVPYPLLQSLADTVMTAKHDSFYLTLRRMEKQRGKIGYIDGLINK